MRVTSDVDGKLARLRADLAGMGRCVVAFSGGVDSTFLLQVAHEVLGERALAITARSESLPVAEAREAESLAARIGARHEWIDTRELSNPRYVRNDADRCYHCKTELFTHLRRIAEAHAGAVVVYGELADDAADFRPGRRAAREFGVRAPLADAGLTKAEVRVLSRRCGLPTADKPALACLASRIPHGTEVTAERLAQVERAEAGLHALGFPGVRVRHHGDVARIEVAAERMLDLCTPPVREQALAAVRAAGFRWAAVDLAGYRPGGLNPGWVPLPVVGADGA